MSVDPLLQLLVDDGHVPRDRVEDLLERRVMNGGSLDTAALEMGFVDEKTSLALLDRAFGFGVATRRDLAHVAPACVAVLPKRIAERHQLCPVSLNGRNLVVAARAPDDISAFESLLEELGFALSLFLKPVLTTEPRLSWALARAYGAIIGPRHEALLALWGEDSDDDVGADAVEDVAIDAVPDVSGWTSPAANGVVEATAAPVFEGFGGDDDSGWSIPAPGVPALPADADGPSAPALSLIVDGTVAAPDEASERLQKHLQKLEAEEQARQARRRQRVLWTVDDALAELTLASSRDELLEVALRFAWRRLQTAAIVVRQGKKLVVWDILDPLLQGHELRAFPLPDVDEAGADHAIARAMRLQSPVLGPVDAADPYVRLLGRRPRAVLIIPIQLGKRVIGAVVGDNGERAIPPSALGELSMVVPRLGRAFGHLILRARRLGVPVVPPPAPLTLLPTPASEAPTTTLEPPEDPLPVAPPVEPHHAAPSILLEEGEEDVVLDDLALHALGPAVEAPRRESSLLTLPVLAPEVPTDDDAADEGHGAEAIAIAPSPGKDARESLLVATWRAWMHQAVDAKDDELDELLTTLGADPAQAAHVEKRLLAAGPRALLAMARAFPGVMVRHPFEGSTGMEPEKSAYFEALLRFGADAVAPILVGELDHDDRLHRWGAVYGLSLVDVPAAVPRLAQRAFDSESRLAAFALQVLSHKQSAPAFETVLVRLRDLCRRGDEFERLRAVRAVAALRDTGAISALIDLLPTRPKTIADEARTALIEITCQDFGTAERRWRAWLADNAARPRRAWLVDGLAHKEVALRRTAADELRDAGVALFDYRPDAPTREREQSLTLIVAALQQAPT